MAELRRERRHLNYTALIALVFALVGASSMLYYHLGLFLPRVLEIRAAKGLGNGYSFGDDFYPIWLTSREALGWHRDPYSTAMTREIQMGLFGRALDARNPADPPVDYRTFAYPAFTDLLLWPSTALEFPVLRLVLVVLFPILTVWSLWLWMLALDWRPEPLWFAVSVPLVLCNYPVQEAFFALQPGLVVGGLLAGSVLALRRNRLLLAGILMALTLIKPQMTLLAIVYLLVWSLHDWQRRARFAQGFFVTSLLLVGASLLVWPHWIGSWLRILFGYHRYATPPLAVELLGPTLGPRIGPVLIAALVIWALAVAYRNRQADSASMSFWLTLSLSLAITAVTILPGQAVYDHVILLPGILLLIRYRREFGARPVVRALQATGAGVCLWPWFTVFALMVARPWLSAEHFYSTTVFALPIRTAGAFPFAVLALLALVMRHTREAAPAPSAAS